MLLSDSRVWVLDTPVQDDHKRDRERLQAILERAGDRTAIVALQRPVEVPRFDRVLVLRRGRIQFDGVPGDWDRGSMNKPEDVAEVVWKAYQGEGEQADLDVPPPA